MGYRSPTRPWLPPDKGDCKRESIEECDAIEYDTETDTYRALFGSPTDSVTLVVASTVAMVSETEPTELPQLCSVVDTDALETLMQPVNRDPTGGDVTVSFTFYDHYVTVKSYGVVRVQPPRVEAEAEL